MSVATELSPLYDLPERVRGSRVPERLASVTTLHRPAPASIAPPVRLTRRGVLVLAVFLALVAAGLVAAARLSAPSAATATPHALTGNTVVVQSGDSLWSIASRVAPQRDPRAEVADLQRVNHLTSAGLTPGQVLRTH